VQPESALDSVIVWTFVGTSHPLNVTHGANTTEWSGVFVASGDVMVEFSALGREAAILSQVTVVPRTNWFWADGQGITTSQGGSWPVGSQAMATVCRTAAACSPLVLPYSGHTHNNGYTRAPVSSGPNAGARYVLAVQMDAVMNALMNPYYQQGGAQHTLSGSDAQMCGTSSAGFYDYNVQCRSNSIAPFHEWHWGHEWQHIYNAMSFVNNYESIDPKRTLEQLVRSSDLLLDTEAGRLLASIPECVQRAAATHTYLTSFPGTTSDVWFWNPANGSFFFETAGLKTWLNQEDDSPLNPPCFV
jgi:hypothetical protein